MIGSWQRRGKRCAPAATLGLGTGVGGPRPPWGWGEVKAMPSAIALPESISTGRECRVADGCAGASHRQSLRLPSPLIEPDAPDLKHRTGYGYNEMLLAHFTTSNGSLMTRRSIALLGLLAFTVALRQRGRGDLDACGGRQDNGRIFWTGLTLDLHGHGFVELVALARA